jgi:UDP-GlcNAc:undecaprenyl-phosphate GlcNAc-1-phosphate transferase
MFENMIGNERPLSWVLQFWPVLAWSFATALAATWLCKKLAIKLGIVDKPNDTVKTHKEPVAYLGGVGILVGLTAGILAGISLLPHDECFSGILKLLMGILVGGTIACFIGLVDDLADIKPWQKILGQLIAAAGLIYAGVLPTGSIAWSGNVVGITLNETFVQAVAAGIVFVFVLGATNSLNLLDGLDGLCAGVTAIITLGMLFLTVHLATWGLSDTGDPVRVIICLGLVGGVMGFLPFNRHPAKIFMGDAGSLLLGFMMAAMMIMFARQIPRWWLASIVIFGLPILDTAVAFARRIMNKRPIFTSDRGHIYDQMMDRGMSLRKTVIVCYLLAGMYAAIGLIMSQIRTRYALIVCILVIVNTAVIVWKEGFLKMEGLRGAVKKEVISER